MTYHKLGIRSTLNVVPKHVAFKCSIGFENSYAVCICARKSKVWHISVQRVMMTIK